MVCTSGLNTKNSCTHPFNTEYPSTHTLARRSEYAFKPGLNYYAYGSPAS